MSEWKEVGTVARLTRYPVKAMGGEDVPSSRIGWHGMTGDRRFALQRVTDLSGLPWASPRDFPSLVTWRAFDRTATADARVELPDGRCFDLPERGAEERAQFSAVASEALGECVDLICLWSGTFDSMALSLLTMTSIASAGHLAEDPMIDARRFRANILIETDDSRDWPEARWVGRELRIGEGADAVVLRVDRHTTRCGVTDVNPSTGLVDRSLFARLREENKNRLGVYATPARVGIVREGAVISLR